jgi:hypothetical protein
MGEKVLFEMRVIRDDDGTRVEVNAAPEWQARHRPRHQAFLEWMGCCGKDTHHESYEATRETKRPAADDLRRALDSLQHIYDDLYGNSAEATS